MSLWKKTSLTNIVVWFLDLGLLSFLIFDFGFENFNDFRKYKLIVLPSLLFALIAFNFYKYYKYRKDPDVYRSSRINLFILLLLIVLEVVMILANYETSLIETFFNARYVIEYGLLFYFFIRLTFLLRKIYSIYFNPAILFVGSFAIIALAGTFILMLPSATTNGITFTDALFTATSATAVTGLIVVDTAKDFTPFGQTIIMILFQIGGLGMLTFTSFFAYFFKSGASFKESLYMKDILGHDKLNSVMKTVMQIVVFSLILEGIGALFIYHSLAHIDSFKSRGFFAVFHAISAYCNAGFSLASNGLYENGLRFNYYMQWVVMGLIVFGGLGYHIAYNVVQYLKKFITNIFSKKDRVFISRVINLNTKIVLYTTVILIAAGTVFFLFSEQQTNLLPHTTAFGKFTTAMFSSVTSRTAGFNTVDMADFTIPGILFMIFLMWIGASPASTGGGIKTTTFALATLNIFAIARDKKYIEIGTRRIAVEAVHRAFAIISISLASIGAGIMLLLIFNPEFSLIQIAFEVFSAFSTVGLSMGITSQLSEYSKYVVIFLMFFGRIGLLNLMIGLLKSIGKTEYTYPEENILIN
ncbi:TrkH family potassium uptake protein [Aequorivita antarctica]|uniref:Potassium transporter n=1 Tax=Aequorivita antarctica TaxID=153266 RepID=A0A5C6Z4U5_9FLAO|nr:potassium transporter TrkG [Aequorivita antarctica]TXD74878.1 potassium transporter [Aequorivita antarctica]SRX72398.1 Ktr system potassium uptake protein B [Aequorivita antarctica]